MLWEEERVQSRLSCSFFPPPPLSLHFLRFVPPPTHTRSAGKPGLFGVWVRARVRVAGGGQVRRGRGDARQVAVGEAARKRPVAVWQVRDAERGQLDR